METTAHGCRLSSFTLCDGAGNAGSANDPTATAIISGFRCGSQNTVEPHRGQKWKTTSYPLSDGRVKV